ncbi:MAG: AAA family ATPase, partial [Thermodesulfobacteriota bacterium]|nr:AAA family ATPase [Thermodesulfobacteriota bacterium]
MKLDAPLAQRVAFKYTLKPFSLKEALEYIDYRLQVAGCRKSPFSSAALMSIVKFSGGVPRLINTVCDNALFETFLRHETEVTEKIVNNVAEDLGLIVSALPPALVDDENIEGDELDDIEIIIDGLDEK